MALIASTYHLSRSFVYVPIACLPSLGHKVSKGKNLVCLSYYNVSSDKN